MMIERALRYGFIASTYGSLIYTILDKFLRPKSDYWKDIVIGNIQMLKNLMEVGICCGTAGFIYGLQEDQIKMAVKFIMS